MAMAIIVDGKGEAVEIRMRKGYDPHAHFREGDMLEFVAPMTARQFAGAVFMPNLVPPITTREQLNTYRDAGRRAVKRGMPAGWNGNFRCLMTYYLTDTLDPREIEQLDLDDFLGAKYYPPGLTTNSDSGVENPASLWTPGTRPYECLRALTRKRKTLMLHAANGLDANGEELDPYDQEIDFIRESLPRIRDAHPDLKTSVEHLSTAEGAEHMRNNGGPNFGCTITGQHLLLDRRDTHRRGIHVHKHWWPIIQSKEHRDELRRLAGEGHPFVFLGTDSAPHPISKKEAECCVGGVLTAHAALELYVEAFELMGRLDRLEAFASVNAAEFYGLPLSDEHVTLKREEWVVPREMRFTHKEGLPFADSHLRPFRAGEKMRWKFVG